MTRTTSARIAGFTFLLYIAAAFSGMILLDRASSGAGTAAKLARIAQHAADVRIVAVLSLVCCFTALVLAVTLYRVTSAEDDDLAMLALTCRAGEGILNAVSVLIPMGLLWLATTAGANAPANALGAFLFKVQDWNTIIAATLFAVGSTLFAYLLLRGRMFPVPLAWLGVIGSALVVVGLAAATR